MTYKVALKDYLVIIFLACLWGSSFFLVKKGLEVFDPYQVGSLRIFISFLALLPAWLFIKPKQIARKKMLPLVIIALLGSAIPPFLFAIAQTKIPSSLAGILNSLTPLFTLIFGVLFFKTKTNIKSFAGVMLGFLGAASLILLTADGSFRSGFGYALLVVLATFCYGIAANMLKAFLSDVHPLAITAIGATAIGPFAGVLAYHFGVFDTIATHPRAWEALGYLAFLGAISTAFALVIFNHLIQRVSALFASTVTYLIPIVAIFWGFTLGEPFGWVHIGGMGAILAGIYLTTK